MRHEEKLTHCMRERTLPVQASVPPRERRQRVQAALRQAQAEARKATVRLLRWARARGIPAEQACERMGLVHSTAREWERRWRTERLAAAAPGPRPLELTRGERQDALWGLRVLGAGASIALLSKLCPLAAREALVEFKQRVRYAAHRRGGTLLHHLEWQKVGSVWAVDFTDPPQPIDWIYPKLLVVRDLASGMQLLALPCASADARAVCGALEELFRSFGAPLVLKEDNGSALIAWEVRSLLEAWGILLMRSPVATPSYNGACEAGIGSLKVRAHHIACADGRPGEWTCDDIEAARLLSNATRSVRGVACPTADQAWSRRQPIDPQLRAELWRRYRALALSECSARGLAPQAAIEDREQASVDRVAIGRALADLELVKYRRRRISPPLRAQKATRNS